MRFLSGQLRRLERRLPVRGILAVIRSAAKDLGVRRSRPFAALRVTGLRSLVSCDTIMYKTVQSFFRLSKEPVLERLTTHLTLAPGASIDLHMHTNYSDGRWPAQQLIDFLVAEGYDLVAVTDHDRVDTVEGIQQLAAQQHLPVLAGVEMSTEWKGKMGHVLCYGFDPEQNHLLEITQMVIDQHLAIPHQVSDALLRKGDQFPRQQ